MTLALSLQAADGLVLASDSRVSASGNDRRDIAEKFVQVNRDIGAMTFGVAEPGYSGISRLVQESKKQELATFDDIRKCAAETFKQEFDTWLKTRSVPEGEKKAAMHRWPVGFVLGGYDAVHTNQFVTVAFQSPDFEPVEIEGPVFVAAQWHIAKFLIDLLYYPEISVEKLCQLTVLLFLETTTIEPTVGGPIQIATVTTTSGFQRLHEEDIRKLIEANQRQICEFRYALRSLTRASAIP